MTLTEALPLLATMADNLDSGGYEHEALAIRTVAREAQQEFTVRIDGEDVTVTSWNELLGLV